MEGSVLFKGKPLDHGTVIFIPAEAGGRQGSGQIQGDGTFELTTLHKGDGVQVGSYKVVIHSLEAHPGEPTRESHEEAAQRGIVRKQEVPDRYTSPETTPLSVKVDENHPGVENFELEE